MENKVKTVKEISEDGNMKVHAGSGKGVFIFERIDLKFDEDGTPIIPSDVIMVHLDKDKKPLTSPEPLTVKADYSRRAFTADSWLYDVPDNFGRRNTERHFEVAALLDPVIWENKHYNATKLASSVLPVSSISPFRVEMRNNRPPF